MNVAYMFAGIGSMRLAFENDCEGFDRDRGWIWTPRAHSPWNFCWTNQWEPPVREDRNVQHAFDIYNVNFGSEGTINADIEKYLDFPEYYDTKFPDPIDLLIAGFPCQDYSVARANKEGIEGKKGVLWWQIHRVLKSQQPRMFLFENVDNLIRSPNVRKRGRDFAIILSSLRSLGYNLEWRVTDSADSGVPQSRKRVFIFGSRDNLWSHERRFVLDAAFPGESTFDGFTDVPDDLVQISRKFCHRFSPMGRMIDGKIEEWRFDPEDIEKMPLSAVLQDINTVAREHPYCIIDPSKINFDNPEKGTWNYAKQIAAYETIGPMPLPDPINRPSRTIITKSTETSPNRENMVICQPMEGVDERLIAQGEHQPKDFGNGPELFRTLSPVEVERVMTFPDLWTMRGKRVLVPRSTRGFVLGNSCPPLEIVKIRNAIEALTD